MTDPIQHRSLAELLQLYQAWSLRETFERLADQAEADGDEARAAELRAVAPREDVGSAVEALEAQHRVSSLLAGWEWHTIRSAREQGTSWADIAHATGGKPESARSAFFDQIDRAEAQGTVDDAEAYRRAAGDWTDELHAGTPSWVRDRIAEATDDPATLAALRDTWWDPSTKPAPLRDVPAPVAADPDPVELARAATDALTSEDGVDVREDQPAEQVAEDDEGWSR